MTILGRPRTFDREAALEAAMRLFWSKGFAAASMNDLCDAMGIRSPSLYAAFGSKETLYLEAVVHYVTTRGPSLWGKLAAGPTARAGIENLLLTATENLPGSETTPPGCMAALAAIGDEWPASITDAVKQIRLDMLSMIRSRLDAAVTGKELPASTDTDRLSRFYLGVFQGMAVQARDGASSAELKGIAETAMMAWPAGASVPGSVKRRR